MSRSRSTPDGSVNPYSVSGDPQVLATNARYERYRWQIFAVTWLIYAAFYILRKSFPVVKVPFESDPLILPFVHMDRTQFGWIDSAFLTAYALGQFVWGPIGDRIGPRRVLLIGVGLCVLSGLIAGWLTTFWGFVIFSLVHGIGQSAGWTNIAKAMSAWFSVGERGRVMAWWCTSYTVGDAIGPPLVGFLLVFFGRPRPAPLEKLPAVIPYWPAGFWGPAAIMAVVFVLAWWWLRDKPEDVGLPSIEQYKGEAESIIVAGETPADEPEGSWKVLREVLETPIIWALSISYFSIKFARYVLMFWGPIFVADSLGTETNLWKSLIALTVLPIGAMIGILLTGYISDHLFQARRIPVSVISLLATMAVMVLGLLHIHSMWLMCTFFFFVGLFLYGPDSILSGAAAMDFGTKKGAGTAAGLINGIGAIGGILGGYLPGRVATKENWSPVFYLIIGGLLVSVLVIVPFWNSLPATVNKSKQKA